MAKLIILAPHASYRINPFLEACTHLNLSPFLVCSQSGFQLPTETPGLVIDFEVFDSLISELNRLGGASSFFGIIGTDDSSSVLAARVAKSLGLPGNSPESMEIARDKILARAAMVDAGLNVPDYRVVHLEQADVTDLPDFPVVLKPRALSASRGVMRCDNGTQFMSAKQRLKRLLQSEYLEPDLTCLVESFIPGQEVAIEGVLHEGKLELLAIFDKPDALDGPWFEETYYLTPSRHDREIQQAIECCAQQVCNAYGLEFGAIHGEFRINSRGVWPLELAARTIGGKCAKLIQYATGENLEEIVIRRLVGKPLPKTEVQGGAGVLMIPVPGDGVVRRVEGIGNARNVDDIEAVEIDISSGQVLKSWPEGGSYPGFIFSRARSPDRAEAALREAHAQLKIVLAPLLPIA